MKLAFKRNNILLRLQIEDALKLLNGEKLVETVSFMGGAKIAWSVVSHAIEKPSADNLDIDIPRSFLLQEISREKPSKLGLSFLAGENTVTIQIDMRSAKSAHK